MKKSVVVGLLILTLLGGNVTSSSKHADASSFADQIEQSTETAAETAQSEGKVFKDIKGHWAESGINQALKSGYVDGYPDGKFLPNNKVSRAEYMKMAVLALHLPVEASSSGSWYTPYIKAAETAGIYIAGDFASTDMTKSMTRLEMSKVAVRALGQTKIEENQWMYLAAKNGIIGGTAAGIISPEGFTTRAQAITVIERVISVKSGKVLENDKYAVAAAEVLWHRTNIFTVAEEIFDGPDNRVNNILGINSWKLSKLTVAAPDGSVVGIVDELLAIDWNDPKDPNRKLLPSKDKLVWKNGAKENMFSDQLQCYVILLKSHLSVNKKPKSYPINRLSLAILGYNGSNSTVLVRPALIQSKDSNKEIHGLVIPKTGFSIRTDINIYVETMSLGAPLYSSNLSTSTLIQ